MNERQLLAILAAILFIDPDNRSGDFASPVRTAEELLAAVDKRLEGR